MNDYDLNIPHKCLKGRQTIGRVIALGKRHPPASLRCALELASGGSVGGLRQPGGGIGSRRAVRRCCAQAVPAPRRPARPASLPENLRAPSGHRRGARGDPPGRSRAVRRGGPGARLARSGGRRRHPAGFGPPRPGKPGCRPAGSRTDPRWRARPGRTGADRPGDRRAADGGRGAAGPAGHGHAEAGRGPRGRRHGRSARPLSSADAAGLSLPCDPGRRIELSRGRA